MLVKRNFDEVVCKFITGNAIVFVTHFSGTCHFCGRGWSNDTLVYVLCFLITYP